MWLYDKRSRQPVEQQRAVNVAIIGILTMNYNNYMIYTII